MIQLVDGIDFLWILNLEIKCLWKGKFFFSAKNESGWLLYSVRKDRQTGEELLSKDVKTIILWQVFEYIYKEERPSSSQAGA